MWETVVQLVWAEKGCLIPPSFREASLVVSSSSASLYILESLWCCIISRLKRVQGFSVHVPTQFRCFTRCSWHKEHNRPVTVLPALSYTGTCHGKSSFHEAQYPSLCLLAEVTYVALSKVEWGRFLPAIRAKLEPKSVRNWNQRAYTWPHKHISTN